MQRFLIKCLNCILLIVVLIGIPAVTGTHFGTLQVSSAATTQRLTLWGLLLGTMANAGAALVWVKDRKNRRLCWEWAIAFSLLLGVEYAFIQGYLNFNWLKQGLLWLQKQM